MQAKLSKLSPSYTVHVYNLMELCRPQYKLLHTDIMLHIYIIIIIIITMIIIIILTPVPFQ